MHPPRRSRLRICTSNVAYPVLPLLFALLAVLAACVAGGMLEPERAAALTPLAGTQGWTEVVSGGFDDKNNEYAADVIEFQGQLFVATIAGPAGTIYSGSAKLGGDLWRSSDGVSWTRVGEPGLGDPQNLTFRLIVYGGELYAVSDNSTTGVQVWRSADGQRFAKVVGNGFGDNQNDSVGLLTTIGDRLVVGTANTVTGAGLWSSTDGTTFTDVAGPELGALPNNGVSSMLLDPVTRASLAVDGRYYLGTADPTTGAEIYRSTDGQRWERVADKGLGRPDTFVFTPSVGFGGRVYAVGTSMQGFDVVRSRDGGKWETVVKKGFGAGENRNISATLLAYDGALYLATQNNDPRVLIPGQPQERFPVQGFQLYRSTDGTAWSKVGDDGFGDAGNFAATLTVENDVLYLSTANYKSGPQVFSSTDGREWSRIFSLEQPSPFNEMGGLVLFQQHVVHVVNDLSKGLSLWRQDTEALVGPGAGGATVTTTAPSTTVPAATTTSSAPATVTTGAGDTGGAGGTGNDEGGSSGSSTALIVLAVVAALAIIGVVVLALVLLQERRRRATGEGHGGEPVVGGTGAGAGGKPQGEAVADGTAGLGAASGADVAFCAQCGEALPPEGPFCPHCGARVR